ncbi:hypothetical protein NVIE_018460 [Nitrososphaera viennensis EN76]|uniref:Uncharacterized protein n=1 Tax=Nitrososphaera viennensis EN76 TaxID=926571 RepID=A0A060HKU1_9ARCH|nr:hypothetical protein NVIE_018460 [Nitrososphaera viennensis EN76]
MNRDVPAAMNLSIRWRSRFDRSQGAICEAMRWNVVKEPLIPRVDAAKLTFRRKLEVDRIRTAQS